VRVPWASRAAGYWNGVDLLERAEPLSALREARAGRGGLVLLSGEAGVGKTAVLRRFAAILGERGEPTRVLWGTCDPLFTPRPLGPFLDIAEQVAGEFGTLVRRGARPHETLAAFLAELGATRPTVAVLEDVHWADEASLDLLGLVARRIEPAGALVVASFRDDEFEPAHPLQTMLGGLATVPQDRRQPVLRHRGPEQRRSTDPTDRARRGTGPCFPCRAGGPQAAGGGGHRAVAGRAVAPRCARWRRCEPVRGVPGGDELRRVLDRVRLAGGSPGRDGLNRGSARFQPSPPGHRIPPARRCGRAAGQVNPGARPSAPTELAARLVRAVA
jgi:AAA ATPase-like protein